MATCVQGTQRPIKTSTRVSPGPKAHPTQSTTSRMPTWRPAAGTETPQRTARRSCRPTAPPTGTRRAVQDASARPRWWSSWTFRSTIRTASAPSGFPPAPRTTPKTASTCTCAQSSTCSATPLAPSATSGTNTPATATGRATRRRSVQLRTPRLPARRARARPVRGAGWRVDPRPLAAAARQLAQAGERWLLGRRAVCRAQGLKVSNKRVEALRAGVLPRTLLPAAVAAAVRRPARHGGGGREVGLAFPIEPDFLVQAQDVDDKLQWRAGDGVAPLWAPTSRCPRPPSSMPRARIFQRARRSSGAGTLTASTARTPGRARAWRTTATTQTSVAVWDGRRAQRRSRQRGGGHPRPGVDQDELCGHAAGELRRRAHHLRRDRVRRRQRALPEAHPRGDPPAAARPRRPTTRATTTASPSRAGSSTTPPTSARGPRWGRRAGAPTPTTGRCRLRPSTPTSLRTAGRRRQHGRRRVSYAARRVRRRLPDHERPVGRPRQCVRQRHDPHGHRRLQGAPPRAAAHAPLGRH